MRPRHHSLSLYFLWAVLTAVVTMPSAGWGQASVDDLTEKHVENIYRRYMPEFAAIYIPYQDNYVPFPKYDPRKDNSSGVDDREWLKKNIRQSVYYDRNDKRRLRPVAKVKPELEAVTRIIPDFHTGSYGYIHSGIVQRVEDDKLTLSSIWLVDEQSIEEEQMEMRDEVYRRSSREFAEESDRHYRERNYDHVTEMRNDAIEEVDWQFEEREKLAERQERMGNMQLVIEGIRTRDIRVGQRWPSDQRRATGFAVVKIVSNRVHAVPVTELRRRLTPAQFEDMLSKRGFDKQKFADLILEARQQDAHNYQQLVIAELERDQNRD